MRDSKQVDRELREADPAAPATMAALELGPAEAALAEAVLAAPPDSAPYSEPTPWVGAERRRRRGFLGLAGTALAAVAAAAILLGGGASKSTSPAYGAELVRFAESSPLLLLEGPGWGVRNVDQYSGAEGWMEFTRGSSDPHPMEPLMTRADVKRHVTPPAVMHRRWRRVELNWFDARRTRLLWRDGKVGRTIYSEYLGKKVDVYERGPAFKTTIPALGVTAYIAPRTEGAPIQGGPGDRAMAAFWIEGRHLIELRASVPSLVAFRQRLDWLRRVDAQAWLDAMPAKVVKAADHEAAVREMLKGIPVPSTFSPSRVPGEGLTTDRYQVGAAVAGTVSCLWLRQWGEARRRGDRAARIQAERAMATSKHWPILREMDRDGDYPEVVWEIAAAMPAGYWNWNGHHWSLLGHAEGLGCARWGIPTLLWKQRRQQERQRGG